jgi:hypothetical protein
MLCGAIATSFFWSPRAAHSLTATPAMKTSVLLAIAVLGALLLLQAAHGQDADDEEHVALVQKMLRRMRLRILEPLCPRGQYIVQGACKYPLIG